MVLLGVGLFVRKVLWESWVRNDDGLIEDFSSRGGKEGMEVINIIEKNL